MNEEQVEKCHMITQMWTLKESIVYMYAGKTVLHIKIIKLELERWLFSRGHR